MHSSGAMVASASEMGRAVSRGGSPLQVCGGLLAASWKKTAKILVNYLVNIGGHKHDEAKRVYM